ncbi:ankyrin repeat [Fusarium beomiforme]|uniref:Ankyrin repeat n=1 Tax=Fusarium beomiforme TaxID=44412 RepID=A0A9P5A7C4_9HYPO|nr:ankyrin repeat [Fusarium beomiforme]
MALVALSSSARSPIAPEKSGKSLEDAIQAFESVLTDDERTKLRHIKAIPDAGAVMTFTAQLDDSNRSRKGRSIASRLHSVLQSVGEFSAFVNTLVSSHPELAALVWGSVQLTMLWKQFSGRVCHPEYFLFYNGPANFTKGQKQLVNALWQSFDQEFKPDVDDIQRCGDEVREEITFAKAQADRQYQELQKKEGETAKQRLGSFMSLSRNKLDKIKEMQLQRDQIESRKQRQQLLESLSSYDYFSPFREACKKRHCGTAQWMFSAFEFNRWKNNTNSSLLWCSGKNPVMLSEEMESKLKDMDQNMFSELEDLGALLQRRIALSNSFYVFLDAVDECEPAERRALLDILSSLGTATLGLRVFLASRESLSVELRGRFPQMERVSMASAGAGSDIGLYVGEALQERKQNGDLVVGDPFLFEEIKCALAHHADGMFLWVTYLIDELCIQYCDDDIRKSLGNLPKDLKETFDRALARIVSRRTNAVAQMIFPWVAVAKRHLTVEELREAISIDIGQSYSKPERRVNGIDRMVSWCENLLHVDEENGTVQFAHRTIYDFITGGCSKPEFADFHVDLEEADHHTGEICITYLHFNDFITTLTRRPQPSHGIMPAAIASTALGRQSKMAKFTPKLRGSSSKHKKSRTNHDIIGTLTSYKRGRQIHHWDLWQRVITHGHDLAQKPWANQEFNSAQSEILRWAHQARHYALIRLIDSCENSSKSGINQIMTRSAAQGDVEVLGVLLERGKSIHRINISLPAASWGGHVDVVNLLLAAGADVNAAATDKCKGRTALQAASEGGHLAVVERLLDAGADVNTAAGDDGGRTALQAASEGGHLAVVERLLAAGADVNAAAGDDGGRTALQAASEGGHLAVIGRLLAAGADVNAKAADGGWRGRTALQAASEGGHLAVVERLLAAEAKVNAKAAVRDGRSALKAAIEGGHLDIVEQLKHARVNMNP